MFVKLQENKKSAVLQTMHYNFVKQNEMRLNVSCLNNMFINVK